MSDVSKLVKAEQALHRWECKLGRALKTVQKLRKKALYYRAKCGFPYLGGAAEK